MRLSFVTLACLLAHTIMYANNSSSLVTNLPRALETQCGQIQYESGAVAEHVDAMVDAKGAMVYVHAGGMHVVQRQTIDSPQDPTSHRGMDLYRMDIDLVGSNRMARREFSARVDGTIRYINEWSSKEGNVALRFGQLIYKEVYPKVDMRVITNALGIKVDYIVYPGGNPNDIVIKYSGSTSVKVEGGQLVVKTPMGSLIEDAPATWTENSGTDYKNLVQCEYVVSGNTVRFNVGEYNSRKTLIIDPQRMWATYYGGNNDFIHLSGGLDPFGNIFIGGSTLASNLPSVVGVVQRTYKGRTDAFFAKFDETGKFIWHTYYGTTALDYVRDIAADESGNVWGCGTSESIALPQMEVGSGPYGEPDSLGVSEAFVVKIDKDGRWADGWYIYGRDEDIATGIALKGDWIAVTGQTRSVRLGEKVGTPFRKNAANNYRNVDIFVARFKKNPNLPNRWLDDWLTFFGGSNDDNGGCVGMDNQGVVYAFGNHQSTDAQISDGSNYVGQSDIVAMKFTTPAPNTPTLAWATQYGSGNVDWANAVAVDGNGIPVLVGYTFGNNFPVVNAFKATISGFADGFIQRFNPANGTRTYSSYFGGASSDVINSVSIDRSNRMWIAGRTEESNNIPITTDAFQASPFLATPYVGSDGFFNQLSENGQTVLYGSYYGGPPQNPLPPIPGMTDPPLPPDTDFGQDEIKDILCGGNAYVVLVSSARSIRMPFTPDAYQDSSKLKKDTVRTNGFLTLFSNCPDSVITITTNGPAALCAVDSRILSAPTGFAKYLWSRGDTTRSITVTDSGTYEVSCTTLDGCRYRDTLVIQRYPQPVVSAGKDTTSCKNVVVVITATPMGGTPPFKYKWKRVETGPQFIDDDTLRTPGVNPNTTSRYEVVMTDSAGCTAKDTVWVSIVDPKPVASPTTIAFGTLDACVASDDAIVTIRNNEVYPITLTSFVPDRSNVDLITSIPPVITLQPGDSTKVVVRITPTAPGTQNGTVTFSGEPCAWKITLPYSVTKATLVATVIPSTLNFGVTVDCDKVERDTFVVVRNGSKDPLNLDPATLVAPFSLVSPTSPITIPPNDTARINFRFTPGTSGVFGAIASMPFTAGSCKDTLRVNLSASVSAVSIAAAPTTIDYGTLEGCDDSRDSSFSISNDGEVPVTITLTDRVDVEFTPTGNVVVQPNTTIKIGVRILPQNAGAFLQTVDIPVNPCNTVITLTLRATKLGISVVSPNVVDFGEVSSCTGPGTSTRTYTLTMSGTTSGSIKSVSTGPSISTTASAGTPLPENSAVPFSVSWTPVADGALIDSIVIVFEPCDIQRVIRVVGVRTSPAITAVTPTVNLGLIAGTATGTIRFSNSGTDTLIANAAALSPGIVVVTTRPATGANILPGQQLEVDYRLACAGRQSVSDSISAFSSTPCAVSANTVFSGTCQQASKVTSTVSIDSMVVKIGDRVGVPLRLLNSSGLVQNGITTWTAKVVYNPMVVVGMDKTPDCFVTGQYAPCEITISGTRSDTVGVLFLLDFTAVLGTDNKTDLVISDFVWTQDSTATITTQNGEIALSDICYDGGERLLSPKSEGFSIKIYPQPASTTLTVEIKGLGQNPATYKMYNYIGMEVSQGTINPDADGNGKEEVDVTSLSSGTYLLTIDARGSVYRMPVIIAR